MQLNDEQKEALESAIHKMDAEGFEYYFIDYTDITEEIWATSDIKELAARFVQAQKALQDAVVALCETNGVDPAPFG